MRYTAVFIGTLGKPVARQEGMTLEEAQAKLLRLAQQQPGRTWTVKLFVGTEPRGRLTSRGVDWLVPPSSWERLLEEDFG